MEPLKEMFNVAYYKRLAKVFSDVKPDFDGKRFVAAVTKDIEDLSLNQRLRNTSVTLRRFLPEDFAAAVGVMKGAIAMLPPGYTNLVFPDYVGLYGQNHFEASMEALKFFTRFGSSEFAVREFLKRDFQRTLATMNTWAGDENVHVRRLASEGSRPRLPWSFKLDEVIKSPELTRPILEKLNNDPELYVRKSVGNHLNDISKDSPEYVLRLIKGWDSTLPHTAWIIKRGCRSLIRKGDSDTMNVFGVRAAKVALKNFTIEKKKLKLNERLEFSFRIQSTGSRVQKVIIQFAIHYVKQSGGRSRKVFHLKELELAPKEGVDFTKTHRFQDFTTRKHFDGKHKLDIIVNGAVLASMEFDFRRA
jgi:3-methyladenine DNA glycosylase AlkC